MEKSKRNPPPQPPYSDRVIARQAAKIAANLSEIKADFPRLEQIEHLTKSARKYANKLLAYSQLRPKNSYARQIAIIELIDSMAMMRDYATLFMNDLQPLKRQIANELNPLKTVKPDIANIYRSLKALQNGGGYTYEDGYITTTTNHIELEDVELGRFEIRLNTRPSESVPPTGQCEITAIDDFAAGDYIHPHVEDGRLCFGEQKAAANSAAKRGDYDAFFDIAQDLLNSYNEDSCYRSLDAWHLTCQECGCGLTEDEKYICEESDEVLCEDCVRTTAGGHNYASRFVYFIDGRDEYYHREDTRLCNACGDRFHRNDLEDGICEECEQARKDEEENEEESEEESQTSNPSRRPQVFHPSISDTTTQSRVYHNSKFVPALKVESPNVHIGSVFSGNGTYRYLPKEAEFVSLFMSFGAVPGDREATNDALRAHITKHYARPTRTMVELEGMGILLDRVINRDRLILTDDRAYMALAFLPRSATRYMRTDHNALLTRLQDMFATPLEAIETACLVSWHLTGWYTDELNQIVRTALTPAEYGMAHRLADDLPKADIESIADIESLSGDDWNIIAVAKFLAGHIDTPAALTQIRTELYARAILPIEPSDV